MKYIHGLERLPLVEIDEEGNERINIMDGLGVVGIKSSGESNYLLKDHLCSTRVVIGEGGEKAGEFDYKDFGETKETAEAGKDLSEMKYRYTGQEWDEELKQYNYLAREYDPRVGRFDSMDPAREEFSPYTYVGDNPINFEDPNGENKVPRKKIDGEEVVGSNFSKTLSVDKDSLQTLSKAQENNVFGGVVNYETGKIYMIPIAASDRNQFQNVAYEGEIKVNGKVVSPVSQRGGVTMHENALKAVLGKSYLSPADKKKWLGFSVTPIPNSATGPNRRYRLESWHGRSRSLNAPKSLENYKAPSDFLASDYYVGTKKSVFHEYYSANSDVYGSPKLAANGTMSNKLRNSIQDAIVRDLKKKNARMASNLKDGFISSRAGIG